MPGWTDRTQVVQREPVDRTGRAVPHRVWPGPPSVVERIDQDDPVVTHQPFHQAQTAHTCFTHIYRCVRRQGSPESFGYAYAHTVISQNRIAQPKDQCFQRLPLTDR
jgi:hypothetical protein